MAKRLKHPKKENLRLWNIYHGIKKRCYNQNCKRYMDYGGRGIAMCADWLSGFDVFADWAKANGYKDDLSIDRIDNDGDYSPDNCKWSTNIEQCRNKRDTLLIEYLGETKPLKTWCDDLELKYDTVHDRIFKRGWPVDKAFTLKSQQDGSFSSMCRDNGINVSVARDRIHKLGWSVEDALSIKSKGLGSNQVTYAGLKNKLC